MSGLKLNPGAMGQARSASMRAVIHRADGTVEDLGVVAYWHRNPLRRWAWTLQHAARRVFKRLTRRTS